jgi:hypothetical protein
MQESQQGSHNDRRCDCAEKESDQGAGGLRSGFVHFDVAIHLLRAGEVLTWDEVLAKG